MGASIASLGTRKDFDRVFKSGFVINGKLVRVRWVSGSDDGVCRVGLVVTKAVGGAVKRNRARRRIKGALVGYGQLPKSDIVVTVLSGLEMAKTEELRRELFQILDNIAEKAPGNQ